MLHKIILWIAALASILGIILYLIDRFGKNEDKSFSPFLVWGLIIGGTALAVIFALTETSKKDDIKAKVNLEKISENSGIIIGVGDSMGGDINVNQGDLTTSASKRYKDAIKIVKQELNQNFLNIGTIIKGVENHPPNLFWDKRRVNESELAFQDRAKEFQRNYINEIKDIIRKFPISITEYNTQKKDLGHNSEIALNIKESYHYLNETLSTINDFIDLMNQNIKFYSSETELVIKNKVLHEEKLVNSKIEYCQAASQYVLTLEDNIEIEIFKEHLKSNGFPLSKNTINEIWQELNRLAANLYKDKAEIIGKQIIVEKSSEQREIERIVKDPYLVMLRKTMGMKAELSEGEYIGIKNKKLNKEENKPQELLSLAALSFIESDGSASEYYLKKANSSPSLSELQKMIISLSLNRILNPDIYEGSIGVVIFDLDENGYAKISGFEQGDVIYKVNGELVYEPLEISSIIGKSDKDDDNLFEFRRNKKVKRIVLKGGKSLNCKATQLIVLNVVQL